MLVGDAGDGHVEETGRCRSARSKQDVGVEPVERAVVTKWACVETPISTAVIGMSGDIDQSQSARQRKMVARQGSSMGSPEAPSGS